MEFAAVTLASCLPECTPAASFLELLGNGGSAPTLQCSKLKPGLWGSLGLGLLIANAGWF